MSKQVMTVTMECEAVTLTFSTGAQSAAVTMGKGSAMALADRLRELLGVDPSDDEAKIKVLKRALARATGCCGCGTGLSALECEWLGVEDE